MTRERAEHPPRQVTTQPQELPPDAGQPDVPHRKVKAPGKAPPEEASEPEPEPSSPKAATSGAD